MEPLACATRDTLLGLREIQRLVSRAARAWSQMNVGGINIPFILQNKHKEMKAHRYEGYFYGGGISAGYHWILSDRFSLEAALGIGYAHVRYDEFKCTACGQRTGKGGAELTSARPRAALSIIYILK